MTIREVTTLALVGLLTLLAPPRAVAVTDALSPDAAHYASRPDGERLLAAIDPADFAPAHLRARVRFVTTESPGSIIVDTDARQLYLIEPDGWAMRYGVSIGKDGFGWTGEGVIARGARWPRWTPPPAMIRRKPSLAKWAGGMPGGPANPLGARALYINFGEHDSGYRVHGTNEPSSIGQAASSGCFRMLNHDVVDLYDRATIGAKIIVR